MKRTYSARHFYQKKPDTPIPGHPIFKAPQPREHGQPTKKRLLYDETENQVSKPTAEVPHDTNAESRSNQEEQLLTEREQLATPAPLTRQDAIETPVKKRRYVDTALRALPLDVHEEFKAIYHIRIALRGSDEEARNFLCTRLGDRLKLLHSKIDRFEDELIASINNRLF